jgi:hypothetical protein
MGEAEHRDSAVTCALVIASLAGMDGMRLLLAMTRSVEVAALLAQARVLNPET